VQSGKWPRLCASGCAPTLIGERLIEGTVTDWLDTTTIANVGEGIVLTGAYQ
jgi:hypothetical protein